MADTSPESGQEQAVQSPPAPKIARPSDAQQPSQIDLETVLKRIDALEAKVRESDRWTQPKHDKRIHRLESELGSLRDTLKRYGVDGEKVDAALERMEYDELKQTVSRLASGSGAGNAAATPERHFDVDEITDIADEFGVAYDDPRISEWGQKQYPTDREARRALIKALKPAPQQQPPPPEKGTGAAVFDGGKGSTVSDKTEQLNTLYARLDELNRTPTANAPERAKVRARIKELGGEL